ncbi:MAG TPA: hypothetical protein VLD18_05365, partial [Verrucomicrobiae bacterium]|nr:hypothetical protein [Verrucomicrobiae bacterium]
MQRIAHGCQLGKSRVVCSSVLFAESGWWFLALHKGMCVLAIQRSGSGTPDHDVRLSTETQFRRCLPPVGSIASFHFPTVAMVVMVPSGFTRRMRGPVCELPGS